MIITQAGLISERKCPSLSRCAATAAGATPPRRRLPATLREFEGFHLFVSYVHHGIAAALFDLLASFR